MAVCPAGRESVELYRSGKKDYVERYVKPLKTKREPVYVATGTRAERVAKGNDFKEVRFVKNTIRPASVEAFLQGAAILFNPEKAKGLSLTLHFEFTGKEQKTATISISDEKIHVHEGHHGRADLYVRADSETWVGILNEEASLVKALITRRLKLRGNPALLKKFKSCML
jgi:alkyl sulfatase BDS1-like metallo-beta-lactamase superfamily hydrolase